MEKKKPGRPATRPRVACIAAQANVGDLVAIEGSIDVEDGAWVVVEKLARPSGNLCNGGHRGRLQVMARRRQSPTWKQLAWWVEDIAVKSVVPKGKFELKGYFSERARSGKRPHPKYIA